MKKQTQPPTQPPTQPLTQPLTQPNSDQRQHLVKLFNFKKKIISEILLLNSAFSIIDQMFHQEMANAQILNEHWFYFYHKPLIEPQNMNPFVKNLMDPFHSLTL